MASHSRAMARLPPLPSAQNTFLGALPSHLSPALGSSASAEALSTVRKQRPPVLLPSLKVMKRSPASEGSLMQVRDFYGLAYRGSNPHDSQFHTQARLGFRRQKVQSTVRLRPVNEASTRDALLARYAKARAICKDALAEVAEPPHQEVPEAVMLEEFSKLANDKLLGGIPEAKERDPDAVITVLEGVAEAEEDEVKDGRDSGSSDARRSLLRPAAKQPASCRTPLRRPSARTTPRSAGPKSLPRSSPAHSVLGSRPVTGVLGSRPVTVSESDPGTVACGDMAATSMEAIVRGALDLHNSRRLTEGVEEEGEVDDELS